MVALKITFHREMNRIDDEARNLPGYTGGVVLRRMIADHGGVEAAKRILAPVKGGVVHRGWADLFLMKRLDLSVEFLIIQPRFKKLFTAAELEEAHQRLRRCGFATALELTPHKAQRVLVPVN